MHRRNHRDRNFQDLGNVQDLGNFQDLLQGTSFRHIDRDSCLEDIYQLTVQEQEKVFPAADND